MFGRSDAIKSRSIVVEHCHRRRRRSIVHRPLCRTFVGSPNCTHAIAHCANRRRCHYPGWCSIVARPSHRIVLPHSWQRPKYCRDPESDFHWPSLTMQPTRTNCSARAVWSMVHPALMDLPVRKHSSSVRDENGA